MLGLLCHQLWQVLEAVQDLVAAHLRMLRGWVGGVPPKGWFSLAGRLSRWRGGLGWAEVVGCSPGHKSCSLGLLFLWLPGSRKR